MPTHRLQTPGGPSGVLRADLGNPRSLAHSLFLTVFFPILRPSFHFAGVCCIGCHYLRYLLTDALRVGYFISDCKLGLLTDLAILLSSSSSKQTWCKDSWCASLEFRLAEHVWQAEYFRAAGLM